MQSGGRRSHAAIDVRIHGLIVGAVAGLRAAIEVWRDGYFAHRVENRSKSDFSVIPSENYLEGIATAFATQGAQSNRRAIDIYSERQFTRFPSLAVAHKAKPSARLCGLEYLSIVARQHRLEAKNLDNSAATRFAEAQTGVDDASIVVDKHAALGQKSRHIGKTVFTYFTVAIKQEFALFALLERVFCYPFVGQRIVEILYFDITNVVDSHKF